MSIFFFLGGAGAVESERLATTVLTQSAANIQFTSINSGYKHLLLVAQARATSTSVNFRELRMQLNSLATNHNIEQGTINNAGTSAYEALRNQSVCRIGFISSAGRQANEFNAFPAFIYNYTSTARFKSIQSYGQAQSGTTMWGLGGTFSTNAAVSNMLLRPDTGSFATGCSFQLYGFDAV